MLGFTATRTQVATYLFGVALFSISFLVFLNSSISFVVTQRIGQAHHVGDAVGTLGFADELVALVACPVWGLLSDRVGVRSVAVIGYTIVGVSLWVFMAAKNVYPQLLLARLLFSLGATATWVAPPFAAPGADANDELQRNHGDGHSPHHDRRPVWQARTGPTHASRPPERRVACAGALHFVRADHHARALPVVVSVP
jgi:Na+/melibiose symporter-like transporter